MTISKNKLTFVILCIVFKTTLEWAYVIQIYPLFSYMGFVIKYELTHYLIGNLLLLSILFLTPTKFTKTSSLFLNLYTTIYLIPLVILWSLNSNYSLDFLFIPISAFLIILFLVSLAFSFKLKYPVIRSGNQIITIISVLFVIGLTILYLNTGVTLNFSLAKVYDFRENNAKLTDFGILAYTNVWTYKVFNMFLMALALLKRRYIWFMIFCTAQIYFFTASAHKAVLFFPLLVLSSFWMFRRFTTFALFPIAYISLAVLALVFAAVFEVTSLSSLFLRRVFLVPAFTTFSYFEFFKDNPQIIWSNSIFAAFYTYPYDTSIQELIGEYEGTYAYANAGFVPTGYAHIGFYGVIIYSIILAYALRLLDSMTRMHLQNWFLIAMTLLPFRTIILSSDLPTVFLSHGLFVIYLIFLMYRKEGVKY